jgi:hypothetical protein
MIYRQTKHGYITFFVGNRWLESAFNDSPIEEISDHPQVTRDQARTFKPQAFRIPFRNQ